MPLGLRLVTTGDDTALVVEREITADQAVITGEPQGRQLQVTARIPETDDVVKPDWRLWWEDPEILRA